MYMMKKIKNYFMPGHQQTYQPFSFFVSINSRFLSLYQQTHPRPSLCINKLTPAPFLGREG